MSVNTGDCIYVRNRSAAAAASLVCVTTKDSPSPVLAMPSIRYRLTELPMPKEKKLAAPLLLRIISKISCSPEM